MKSGLGQVWVMFGSGASTTSRVWVEFGLQSSGNVNYWQNGMYSNYPQFLGFHYNESFECWVSGQVRVSVFMFGSGFILFWVFGYPTTSLF